MSRFGPTDPFYRELDRMEHEDRVRRVVQRNPICPCCSVGLWRRTFWFFMYLGRWIEAPAVQGSLHRRHLGGEWP